MLQVAFQVTGYPGRGDEEFVYFDVCALLVDVTVIQKSYIRHDLFMKVRVSGDHHKNMNNAAEVHVLPGMKSRNWAS